MDKYKSIIDFVQAKKPNFTPIVGLILGSGLGELADNIEQNVSIDYADIPYFPIGTVAGHKSRMHLGYLSGVSVVCLQGRVHTYEGADAEDLKIFVRILKLLGCDLVIMTNAAGSLCEKVGPGDLSIITDHINLAHRVPLIGPNEEKFGTRFFALNDAYDVKLRDRFHLIAKQSKITLNEGVYISTTGPCFETPAEINAFRLLGADLVGMSTVPEVIVARHCGLRVVALSVITNYAAGMKKGPITHEETLYHAKKGADRLARLIRNFMLSFQDDVC